MPVLIQENNAFIPAFKQHFLLYVTIIDIDCHTVTSLRVHKLKLPTSLIFTNGLQNCGLDEAVLATADETIKGSPFQLVFVYCWKEY